MFNIFSSNNIILGLGVVKTGREIKNIIKKDKLIILLRKTAELLYIYLVLLVIISLILLSSIRKLTSLSLIMTYCPLLLILVRKIGSCSSHNIYYIFFYSVPIFVLKD